MPKYQVILQEFTKERYKFTQLPLLHGIVQQGAGGGGCGTGGEIVLNFVKNIYNCSSFFFYC
jgi:hypothetical protein